jgi:hypothetical protein
VFSAGEVLGSDREVTPGTPGGDRGFKRRSVVLVLVTFRRRAELRDLGIDFDRCHVSAAG